MIHEDVKQYLERATQVSGCGWDCHQLGAYKHGFRHCCSTCQGIALLIAKCVTEALPRPETSGDKAEECRHNHHWFDAPHEVCRCGLMSMKPGPAVSA